MARVLLSSAAGHSRVKPGRARVLGFAEIYWPSARISRGRRSGILVTVSPDIRGRLPGVFMAADKGRALAGFRAFKNHCSLSPYGAKVMDLGEAELKSYETSKWTIRFPIDKPPSSALVKTIVKTRIEEIDGERK
jgi:hypothetical protein